jgi:DNA repair exonuclease SbcCD nuclease subunit
MKIFVTGDNHLGRNLKKRKILRDCALANFKAIPSKIKKDVSYVILAGDTFDKDNTDIECCSVYMKVLQEIVSMRNIKKVFIISGNHDSYNEYYSNAAISIADTLNSKKIVTCSNEYKCISIPEDNLFISLLPWNKKLFLVNEGGNRNIADYLNNIKFEYTADTQDMYKIMVSHFPISDWMPFASFAMSLEDLERVRFFNLMILGDLHNEKLKKIGDGNVDILYTGSTMQTSIEDLKNHRNIARVLTIEDNTLAKIEDIPFAQPRVMLLTKDTEKDAMESDILVTDDIKLYMKWRDRCVYVLYKPGNVVKDENGELSYEAGSDLDSLDINAIAKSEIDKDDTTSDDEKIFLKKLLDMDPESLSADDIQKRITEFLECQKQ